MRRAFPQFTADWLFTLVIVCSKTGGKSLHALRGDFEHDRCNEKEYSGAELSGERSCDQTANNSANRSAHSNETEKPFGLLRSEHVSHEGPEHRCRKKIENADPDEKYGRKNGAFLRRRHPPHEEEE